MTQGPAVQLQNKTMNAGIAGHAGTPQLKQFLMVNIKTEFPRGISDQVISSESGTPPNERAPGPGLKPQATRSQAASDKLQAPSNKRQAPSCKLLGT